MIAKSICRGDRVRIEDPVDLDTEEAVEFSAMGLDESEVAKINGGTRNPYALNESQKDNILFGPLDISNESLRENTRIQRS